MLAKGRRCCDALWPFDIFPGWGPHSESSPHLASILFDQYCPWRIHDEGSYFGILRKKNNNQYFFLQILSKHTLKLTFPPTHNSVFLSSSPKSINVSLTAAPLTHQSLSKDSLQPINILKRYVIAWPQKHSLRTINVVAGAIGTVCSKALNSVWQQWHSNNCTQCARDIKRILKATSKSNLVGNSICLVKNLVKKKKKNWYKKICTHTQ